MQINLTPRAVPMHWTSAYIGRPWELGAEGPAAFDCWGLARAVQRDHYARELPQLRVATERLKEGDEQLRVLLDLMRHTGWRLLPDWQTMEDGDLLRMAAPMGPHIGIAVRLPRQAVTVLHCVGGRDLEGVSHGAVERAEVRQLVAEGFGQFAAWRWHG
jgi:hypothetical protein